MAEETEATKVKERKPRVNVKWECPKCGESVILHFIAQYPPTCSSKKHSASGTIVMVKK